jgi:hypothetical protein
MGATKATLRKLADQLSRQPPRPTANEDPVLVHSSSFQKVIVIPVVKRCAIECDRRRRGADADESAGVRRPARTGTTCTPRS